MAQFIDSHHRVVLQCHCNWFHYSKFRFYRKNSYHRPHSRICNFPRYTEYLSSDEGRVFVHHPLRPPHSSCYYLTKLFYYYKLEMKFKIHLNSNFFRTASSCFDCGLYLCYYCRYFKAKSFHLKSHYFI